MAVGGPALFLGADTPCVALLRPELDVNDPELRLAAERAGVSAEEFAGESGVWQVMADRTDGQGRSFELPELTDGEVAAFTEELLHALVFGDADGNGAGDGDGWSVELGTGALLVTVRDAGDDRAALTVRVVPPAGAGTGAEAPEGPSDTGPLDVELATLPVAELRAEVADFRRSFA
ncbi:hypothetical protein [Streptomyces sp. NPDC089799]|uniref:hypothetical protein n=1 Tax=Streptomyces sp. NPDC089799 TaxID=3155066 RepID=UPI003412CCC4